jgi:Uma2 family endonuclease
MIGMATNIDAASAIPQAETVTPANGSAERDSMPIIAIDLPVMYEDEGQDEMGESQPHVIADRILSSGLEIHFERRPEYQVFANLNLHYHRIDQAAYVSPDIMVTKPKQRLAESISTYRIGEHGPAPELTIEILSRRSYQQQDLTLKPTIYSELGVAEYVLVDATGVMLEQRLLLRRLQADGTWVDEQDNDGGVTSLLGFRIVIEDDGKPRVIDTATGKRYVRPGGESQERLDAAQANASAEAAARRQLEERNKALEAELARLRGKKPE